MGVVDLQLIAQGRQRKSIRECVDMTFRSTRLNWYNAKKGCNLVHSLQCWTFDGNSELLGVE